ncbi:MAG: PhnD/SsuA/transferrin family substrate-binding protein [Gemmatales bacterium]
MTKEMSLLTRRTFMSFLAATPFLNLLGSAQGKAPLFEIGIADFVMHGQMKTEVANIVVQAMADVFAIPGKPKPTFQFGGPMVLGGRLQKHDIHLAIMTGIEYAWISSSFPELVPLVTAFTSDIRLKACIVVPTESKAESFSHLKGQSIVLPKRLQHFPLLYLQQEILEQGVEPKNYFSRILLTNDTDEGIETVVDKKASGILVDSESWKVYQERKPGRAKKLKVIDESDSFPTSAVLYHPQAWAAADLKLVSDVLCTAHTRPFTRQILNFWRISKFIPYSHEYQTVVKDILNEMPKPMMPFAPG